MLHIEEIIYQDPIIICQHFAHLPGTVFLDSAKLQEEYGKYSFIAIDPFMVISASDFSDLRNILVKYTLETNPELPPFQGGMAGYLSYDLRHSLEKLPYTEQDDLQFADMFMGVYDLVLSFDNINQRAWICSSGYPEETTIKKQLRAQQRSLWVKNILQNSAAAEANLDYKLNCDITSNFSKATYESAVTKTKEYILDGDIFQANIAQRFTTAMPDCTPFELYQRLRTHNPAPFAAYINVDNNAYIASASPERFLKLTNRTVEARPIKGTAARNADPTLDQQAAEKLLSSPKDRAENIMIVDLMRNDLSKVCMNNSVMVPQLCGLESYATVHHLVSIVTGHLQTNKNAIDLLEATFPGGSITGAPKIRAMEIISEIEKQARGPYCGSIGYIGFNGAMDMSITIRSFAIKNKIVTFHAGGAIVLDSDPTAEYAETLLKAQAMCRVLNDSNY